MITPSIHKSVQRVAGVLLCLILLLPNISPAATQIHGAKAAGMGTAFVAIADDPSAIAYNPAGLTRSKGTNVYAGGTAVILSSEYTSPSDESEESKFQVFFPPHLYLTSDFGMQNKTVGLGIYSPFGIGGRKWSEGGLTRYASTDFLIATLNIHPTFAWEITPGLSVGFGVLYLYAINDSERMVDQSALGAEDGKLSVEVDGGGWGYSLGLLVGPFKKFSFGLAYRSGVKVDQSGKLKLKRIAPGLQPLFGGSQFKTDVDTDLDFPQIVSFGIAYKPSTKLTLALDAEWIGWSSFDEQKLELEDEVPSAGISDSTIDLDWNDVWTVKAGLEYRISDEVALRTGYTYVETPVPEKTLSPAYPDADQHMINVGFGYQANKWVADFFYTASLFEERKVNNSILSGKYESITHLIGFSFGYRF